MLVELPLLVAVGAIPLAGRIVPFVIGVKKSGAIGDPRRHKVWPFVEKSVHVSGSPIVTHDVDRFTDRREFTDQPVDVVRLTSFPSFGRWNSEARGRQQQQLISCARAQNFDEQRPHRIGLGIAVNEDLRRHRS